MKDYRSVLLGKFLSERSLILLAGYREYTEYTIVIACLSKRLLKFWKEDILAGALHRFPRLIRPCWSSDFARSGIATLSQFSISRH